MPAVKIFVFFLTTLHIIPHVTPSATWPSPWDELEDLMVLQSGYRSRGFAAPITPCGYSPAGGGRNGAAEYLRSAFHDAATGNAIGASKGIGGMDGSLIFELTGALGADNVGPGFTSTVTNLAPYLSSRSSMADLLSLGLHVAVRTCGGPAIPLRTGRVDASSANPPGVPAPQNSIGTFQNQFSRMGFSNTEMIQLVVCGHSIGGVHSGNFPNIVTPGSVPDEVQSFDTTIGAFDEKVAKEYVSGNTSNPLVSGTCRTSRRCSDSAVFGSDGNVTVSAMANADTFQSTCSLLLQRLIELVPSGVELTDAVRIYDMKPYNLQLSVLESGAISFSGEIRVRTGVNSLNTVQTIQVIPKGLNGDYSAIDTTLVGTGSGFNETFSFFAFSSELISSPVSSFAIIANTGNGMIQNFDNNGQMYPIQDTIIFDRQRSCFSATGNADVVNITVVGAVRKDVPSPTVDLRLTIPSPRPPIVVPKLVSTSVPMTLSTSIDRYDFYSATYQLQSSQRNGTTFGVAISGGSNLNDDFKSAGELRPC